jgi:hypothetical protein
LIEGSIFSVVVSTFTSSITSSTGREISCIAVGRVSSEVSTVGVSLTTVALSTLFSSLGSTPSICVSSD